MAADALHAIRLRQDQFTIRPRSPDVKKTAGVETPAAGIDVRKKTALGASRLLLPSALLVTISLQALLALVLVHLEAALFLEITHGEKGG